MTGYDNLKGDYDVDGSVKVCWAAILYLSTLDLVLNLLDTTTTLSASI